MSRVSCWRWGFLIVAALAFLGLNGMVLAADAAAGKAIYEANACSACHGATGNGGLGPSLNTAAFAEKYANTDKLVEVIRKGAGSMPGYGEERIGKADMDSLVTYTMSLSKSSAAGKADAIAADKAHSEELYYGLFTMEQLYGLAVLGIGTLILLFFALVLNGPLKVRT